MKFFTSLSLLASLVAAAVVPTETISDEIASPIEERQDSQCTNGPTTRACWGGGYSIATDFDQKHPTTGNTVTYNLEISNGTCNPDGHGSRICFLINGQYPGPTIRANWGDYVVVNVKNSMPDNGTAMHWHGVRQLNSCGADGVPGITQCPIAPGVTYQYTFQATQFGTSWYHSHFSNQYGDGVVGAMIFEGPATANYDIDLGNYDLTDWYYRTAFEAASISRNNLQVGGGPPASDNILINGTNKNAAGGGAYNQVKISKGKKYRLRLINMSIDAYIRVSLDNHTMQVMTSDYVPVKPYSAQWLLLAIGQRYDVVINANQTAGNYWFRADIATDCFSASNNGVARAIWTYDTITTADPTTSPYAEPSDCTEPTNVAPYWVQPVPSGSFAQMSRSLNVNFTTAQVVPGGDTVVVWALNTTNINVNWSDPTLSYVFNKDDDYPRNFGVIPTLSEGSWNYWLIQQTAGVAPPIPHPIHLHGHDFFVLGQGKSAFTGTETLNFATPPRRDTATVYGGGWLALAFDSNNPGAWLMHCHIAWHISEGLGMQFVENVDQMLLPDATSYNSLCDSWKAYEKTAYYHKDDSGL